MGSNNSRHTEEECTPNNSSSEANEAQPLLAQFHGYDQGGVPRTLAPVTQLVKESRYAIINALDTSLTRKELGSPEIYFALLLPIVRKYREERRETAAVYCFLLNRWQFLKDAENDLANARLNETRAHACEIVATKVLKAFTMRQLIDVLTFDFSPVKRKDIARSRIYLPHFDGEPSTEPMSAIEVAILGRAKNFISNALVQEIINQIWLGEVVFFSHAIDNPKSCLYASQQENRTVTVYDSRHIKFLRLSRLRVPRYKTTFQMVSFSVFIFVYSVVTFEKSAKLTAMEVIMDIFALSYTIDEFFQLKGSGPSFYFETVWNLFDVPIYIIFILFIILRIITFFTGSIEMSDFAYDFLACNSILLWPRLFAALDHYKFFGTMLIVLRQMLIDAGLFIALSLIFYLGFLQAFYTLHDNKKSYGEIAWLLLQVFFGSAFLGFEQASEISKEFGAPLMVVFVAISVLMLYTLLISIFSQTFSDVSANAKEEFMFMFSVKVMEEVKSDVLYEFQPPFNILAGLIVVPCRFFLHPRAVGKVSRVLLRILYFPELACIWAFEMMVLRKRHPYIPVRPGNVEHQRFYNTGHSNPELDTRFIGGGVAKRRHDERNGAASLASKALEPLTESSIPPMESNQQQHHHHPHHPHRHNNHNNHNHQDSNETGHSSESSSSTTQQQPQHIHQLTIGGNEPSNTNEILSPYFENIRRFRDSNKHGSVVTTPSQRSENEVGFDNIQNSYYYPTAPIGMGITRQGSISGYRRSRHGTEATLANTYQGVSSSYHNGMMGDIGLLSQETYQPEQYPQHHNQHQQHHQFYDGNQDQGQQDEIQELGRIMEIRQTEMQARMDQLESKLDLLIAAIANQNKKDD